MTKLTVAALQSDLGVEPDGKFGQLSTLALFKKLTNTGAVGLTDSDYAAAASRLGVPVGHIKGIHEIETPRGAFDDHGRPSILYERHKFRDNCDPVGVFNNTYPALSGGPYGPGGYGPYSVQYDKLAQACALDPHAAFAACSWGAFQVLGEYAVALGYGSPYEMAKALTTGEAAHLDCLVRFIEWKGLKDELRACKPGNSESCIPFVKGYNGAGFRQFNYHVKFASAI